MVPSDLTLPADSFLALLTPAQMAQADRAAIASGTPGIDLMEAAGLAVARAIEQTWSPRPVLVLCGPGNNGGDGFVVARLLAQAGWLVQVGLLGPIEALRGDAAHHAYRWRGPVSTADPGLLAGAGLVVDALFGAGLRGPLAPPAQALLRAVADSGLPVCAVDLPSGLDGESGQPLGEVAAADLTVTFCRAKPGHWLLPGRALCGRLVVADIGIPPSAVAQAGPQTWENSPELWLPRFPWPRLAGHKYARGHVLVSGGARMTGAARLAGQAAARAGAGLVTLAVPAQAWPVYAAASPASLLIEPCDDEAQWQAALADRRRNCVLIGPGAEPGPALRAQVLAALAPAADEGGGGGRRALVLDAGALTAFEGQAERLAGALHGACMLTPHQWEFDRLFPPGAAPGGDKAARARQAARSLGAVVLLKGADTVLAAPDGRVLINRNAPPALASGGTGDVLAGLVAGLLAQGMPALGAAAAAAWLHGEAGRLAGPGLVADDLPARLPRVLRRLAQRARAAGCLPADADPAL